MQTLIKTMEMCCPDTMTGRNLLRRYKDIYNEYRQDFARNRNTLQQKKDSFVLFGHLNVNRKGNRDQSSAHEQLLRERSAIQNSSQAIDRLLDEASAANIRLKNQGTSLTGTQRRLVGILKKIPGVDSLVTRISRRRNRDTMILAAVIAVCFLFTLWYLFH